MLPGERVAFAPQQRNSFVLANLTAHASKGLAIKEIAY
jgi:hypothetical protein